MKYIAFLASLLLLASPALAAVTVVTTPTSLVTSPATASASSAQIPLFEFALNQTAGETLSSVTVNFLGTAVNTDLASVSVYKDDGSGAFNGADSLAGSNTTVNVGSNTVINTSSNNTLTGGKFFVTMATSSAWGAGDGVTVSLIANGIATSSNSPTTSAVTTAAISFDNTAPALNTAVAVNSGGTAVKEAGDSVVLTFSEATNKATINASNIDTVLALNNSHSWKDGAGAIGSANWNSAGTQLTVILSAATSLPTVNVGDVVTIGGTVIKDLSNNNAVGNATITGDFITDLAPTLNTAVAQNTGGTSAKEAGDSVLLTFSEATNKPVINASNIDTVLVLNNSHSWKDGAGAIGSANWNSAGTQLTVTLSAATSLPTVSTGDTVTATGSVIKDLSNNNATGTVTITGDFATTVTPPPPPGGDEVGKCSNTLINGRLYKVANSPTVYLAAACRLKPFRGAAVFHARGNKFKNIITLSSLDGFTVSDHPALPAGGTLVKGSDKTIWFLTNDGKRKGFVSANAFTRLGFKFSQTQTITDDDLNTIDRDSNIEEDENEPDGTVMKCGNSATIFEVKGNTKFPFASLEAFTDRGHSFEHVVTVDCGKLGLLTGGPISTTSSSSANQ